METKKLYKFLLVDSEMLDRDSDFKDFWAMKRGKSRKLYDQLFIKYAAALTVLGCYQHHFEKMIGATNEEKEKLLASSEKKKEEADRLKKESGIGDDEIKALLKSQTYLVEPQDMRIAQGLKNDAGLLEYANKIMKLRIESYIDMSLADQYERDSKEYEISKMSLKIIKKALYRSYGFYARSNGYTVSCEQEELIGHLNFIYFFNIYKKGKWVDEPEEDGKKKPKKSGKQKSVEDDKRFMLDAEKLMQSLDIKDGAIGQQRMRDWLVCDVIRQFVETVDDNRNVKKYLDDDTMKMVRKMGEDIRDVTEEKIAVLEKALEELTEYFKSEKYATRQKEDKSFVLDVCVDSIRDYMERIKDVKEGYFRAFTLGDPEYEKITEYYDDLDECVRAYDSFRNGPNVRIKNERQRVELIESRSENWKKREEKFLKIIEILEDIKELKRNSLVNVLSRVCRDTKTKSKMKGKGIEDADLQLYNMMFRRLKKGVRKEVNNVFKDKDIFGYVDVVNEDGDDSGDFGKDMPNGMYVFGGMGILTLTFWNTKIEKYKTAAVIVDVEDLERIAILSRKCAWTFKGGKEINKRVYGHRAYAPDRIVENNGKVRLAEHIKGVDPKEKECFLKSHKFDFRKSNIGDNEEERKAWKKTEKEKYFPGAIWIGDGECDEGNKGEMELDEGATVCMNGEDNAKGASILYFDDSDKLKRFLKSIE